MDNDQMLFCYDQMVQVQKFYIPFCRCKRHSQNTQARSFLLDWYQRKYEEQVFGVEAYSDVWKTHE